MKQLLSVVFFLLSVSLPAQKRPADPRPYAATITVQDLQKHLSIVASKEMEGRETATEGQRKAATYIEGQLKDMGLQPGTPDGYQQVYPVYRDSALISRMVVKGNGLLVNQDFQPAQQFNNEGHMYFSEITFAGYGVVDSSYNSYSNNKLQGKAVLIVEGGPEGLKGGQGRFSPTSTFAKIQNAREKGVAAIFIVSANFRQVGSGAMYTSLYRDAQYPMTYLISDNTAMLLMGSTWPAMKENLQKERNEPKAFKTELEISLNRKVQKLQSSNVLGVLEGTDKKDEYLVITAHYDHLGRRGESIYYGADDDGSGTVSVLEIAEAFAKAKAAGKGPRRSVIFMTVSGEEKGLWGSNYYSNHPTVSPEKITANLNIDMIGRVDTERKSPDTLNYVYVVGDDKLSSELKPLSEGINKAYTRMVLDYKFNDPKDPHRIYFRSDHYNFARIGVPIIFYYDGMLQADYHQPTDTIDKINFKLMAKRAQLVFYTAWEMANRESMIKRDKPLE